MNLPNKAKVGRSMAQAIREHGFYVEAVLSDPQVPQGVNVHTHGLPESCDHPDLQICVPMQQDYFMEILHLAVALIRAGVQLTPGTSSAELIEPYDVHFIAAAECGRPVVRLIFPDLQGRYEDGELGWQYHHLHLDELA